MTDSNDLTLVRDLLVSPSPVRWVFAGDSITHGALHTFGARDYTEHFSERLRYEMGRGRDHVIKTGISGWTIRQLWADIDWCLMQYAPDMVSLNFGMNDCVMGEKALPDFEEKYRSTLTRLRADPNRAIVLHVPNPILPNDTARAASLPAFSEVVRRLAAEFGCLLIDHPALWQGRSLWYLMSDAIHPNDMGHRLMAHLMLRELGMWDEKSPVCNLFVPPGV
ncbi:MAG: SGNH/GDSL hydrolase family protein [Planctomycetes bacterium]|nr:SGNH/GDSL hydrolase family protein [Planctomycetota bacterium]